MRRTRTLLLLILPGFILLFQCAAGLGDDAPRPDEIPADAGSVQSDEELTEGESVMEAEMAPLDVASPLIILEALVSSYPGRITEPALRDGDWSVLVNDRVIYWADGKLLSAGERPDEEKFRSYSFRPNPEDVPPIRDLTPEEEQRLRDYISGREEKRDLRSEAFMKALWGMEGYWESEETVIIREFLGTRIRIHPEIEQPLMQVQAAIMEAVETDPEVDKWYRSLGAIGGYVWRDIAGSANRSLHSYGIAIDVQPRGFGSLQAYWRWTSDLRSDWWAVPLEERYRYPDAVIDAFESQGFFWGGKWFLYDQIHFEYRPEIILLGEWARGGKR